MSSTRALSGIWSLSLVGLLAAVFAASFPGISTGQQASAPPQQSLTRSPSSAEALSTLWSDHIWRAIPESELGSLSASPVSKTYEACNWQPVFINSSFKFNEKARDLFARLKTLGNDAIDPAPFDFESLSQIYDKLKRCRAALAEVDPQFDQARAPYFLNGQSPPAEAAGDQGQSDQARRRQNIALIARAYMRCFQAASEADTRLTALFFLFTKEMDPFCPLANSIKALSGDEPLSQFFTQLEPKGFGYRALRSAYQQYSRATGAEPVHVNIPYRVRLGRSGPEIGRLQERLRQLGFYSGEITDVFDRATQSAVRDFQIENTLHPDGLPGRWTQARLNASSKRKAALIAYSLNALRNSPCRQYDRFIRVNIPQFMLEYYNNGQLQLTEKVVVGKAAGKKVNRQGRIVGENQTPTMASQIEQIIFNPRWYVNGRIRLELNAKAKSNPEWFEEHGYVKMDSRYPFGEHRIFQKSGPKNALGQVKFDFPNPYAVYLHDTDEKSLFHRTRRDFSHGCIRVDNALELAKAILEDEENPCAQKIPFFLKSIHPEFIKLDKPVPISVEYIPVVAESGGRIDFAGDPYGYVNDPSQLARENHEETPRLSRRSSQDGAYSLTGR